MYWFVGNGTAYEISTAKLPVLSKILKESMATKNRALISSTTSNNLLTYDISGNQSMNVQNESFGDILKKGAVMDKIYRDFFRLWNSFPSSQFQRN